MCFNQCHLVLIILKQKDSFGFVIVWLYCLITQSHYYFQLFSPPGLQMQFANIILIYQTSHQKKYFLAELILLHRFSNPLHSVYIFLFT